MYVLLSNPFYIQVILIFVLLVCGRTEVIVIWEGEDGESAGSPAGCSADGDVSSTMNFSDLLGLSGQPCLASVMSENEIAGFIEVTIKPVARGANLSHASDYTFSDVFAANVNYP